MGSAGKGGSAGTASQGGTEPADVDEEVDVPDGDDGAGANGIAQVADSVSGPGPKQGLLTMGCSHRGGGYVSSGLLPAPYPRKFVRSFKNRRSLVSSSAIWVRL